MEKGEVVWDLRCLGNRVGELKWMDMRDHNMKQKKMNGLVLKVS